MSYWKIIEQAWDHTLEQSSLIWLAFIPSFATVSILVTEIAWSLYLSLGEFGFIEKNIWGHLSGMLTFLQNYDLLLWGVLLVVLILVFGFLVPPLLTGTLISSAARLIGKESSTHVSLPIQVGVGTQYYFRLFQLNALTAPFSIISILLFTFTFYRYLHGEIFDAIWPFILAYALISVVIWFFLSYVPFIIVGEDQSMTSAIRRGVLLCFQYFRITLMVTLIMMLINIRVVINILAILGVPFLLLLLLGWFQNWGLLIGIILGVGLLFLAAYLTAIMEVFLVMLWQQVYGHISQHFKSYVQDTIQPAES